MRSLSLLLLLAAAVYAQEITDNGYAIPEYDPMPSDGEPTETEENTDWSPPDRELSEEGDDAVVDNNDIDGGKAETTFHHGHGQCGNHGCYAGLHHGHFPHPIVHRHNGYPFRRFHHGRPCARHYRPTVVVTDRHHVIGYPKKPCKKIVKHVTVHTHVPHRHHHHHDSSSSEEVPCGCRAHRHGGHHHHHHSGEFGHHHGHHFGHHGHGYLNPAIAPFF